MSTFTVRCENPSCSRAGVQRVAARVKVGDGLHLAPLVRCDCGAVVAHLRDDEVERRPVAPAENTSAKGRPAGAVKRPPERRG